MRQWPNERRGLGCSSYRIEFARRAATWSVASTWASKSFVIRLWRLRGNLNGLSRVCSGREWVNTLRCPTGRSAAEGYAGHEVMMVMHEGHEGHEGYEGHEGHES
jgi:hypothetical protein